MIPNIGAQAVADSRLTANDEEYKQFMRRRHNRLLYYNAETDDLTRKWFSSNLLKNVPVANINITKRIIDRTSEVYMIKALRYFENDSATQRYSEKTPRKDERMQRVERMTNLLDVVAVHPFWNESNGYLDHMILIEFKPEFDMWGNLVGITYPLRQSANVTSLDEQTFVHWGLDGWRVTNVHGVEKKAEPYVGKFPFSLAWTEEPDYFYDHNPSADLVQGNLCINFFQTAMNANVGFQSFGQPYVTGLRSDDVLEWGIDKIPTLPEGASAGMLTPPSTVQDVITAQSNLYRMIARNYHLPDDFVEGSAQAESGVAIKLRNQELQNERVGDVVRWKNVEHELFDIERDILAKMNVSLPEEIFIDFSESVEYLSPQEQRERDEWDLEHNLITVKDIAMRQNPDLDEAQAEQLIMDNATKAGAVKKVSNGRTSIVDDILGT